MQTIVFLLGYRFRCCGYVTQAGRGPLRNSRSFVKGLGRVEHAWFSATNASADERKVAQNHFDVAGRLTHRQFGDITQAHHIHGGPGYSEQFWRYDADGDLKKTIANYARHDWTTTLKGRRQYFDYDAYGADAKGATRCAENGAWGLPAQRS